MALMAGGAPVRGSHSTRGAGHVGQGAESGTRAVDTLNVVGRVSMRKFASKIIFISICTVRKNPSHKRVCVLMSLSKNYSKWCRA